MTLCFYACVGAFNTNWRNLRTTILVSALHRPSYQMHIQILLPHSLRNTQPGALLHPEFCIGDIANVGCETLRQRAAGSIVIENSGAASQPGCIILLLNIGVDF